MIRKWWFSDILVRKWWFSDILIRKWWFSVILIRKWWFSDILKTQVSFLITIQGMISLVSTFRIYIFIEFMITCIPYRCAVGTDHWSTVRPRSRVPSRLGDQFFWIHSINVYPPLFSSKWSMSQYIFVESRCVHRNQGSPLGDPKFWILHPSPSVSGSTCSTVTFRYLLGI